MLLQIPDTFPPSATEFLFLSRFSSTTNWSVAFVSSGPIVRALFSTYRKFELCCQRKITTAFNLQEFIICNNTLHWDKFIFNFLFKQLIAFSIDCYSNAASHWLLWLLVCCWLNWNWNCKQWYNEYVLILHSSLYNQRSMIFQRNIITTNNC